MPVGRPVTRRAALQALGSTAGAIAFLPWLSENGRAAFAEVQATKGPPALKVLSAAQYATTEALVEAIIPADERSPGAREARVADYIDLLLTETPPARKQEWLLGLAALDAEAKVRFSAPFARLQPAQVEALLTDLSGWEVAPPPSAPDAALDVSRNEQPKEKPLVLQGLVGDVIRSHPALPRTPLESFFAVTKRATVHGYYTSEIGIHKELRYKGNQVIAEFVGCETENGKACPHCGQKAEA